MADKQKSVIKPILHKLTLAPELRDEAPKGAYPRGRVKQIFDVFRAEMQGMAKVNFWLLLYSLPLIALVLWGVPYAAVKVVSDFNYMGNVGIGYPGSVDSASEGMLLIYKVYRYGLLASFPCSIIVAVGLAGGFYCAKKYMWGDKITKITPVFYKGVKQFAPKFILYTALSDLIIIGAGNAVIWLLEMRVMGTLEWWIYVVTILCCLIAFVLLSVNNMIMPMTVTYKMPLKDLYKNSFILNFQLFIISAFVTVIGLLPFTAMFGSGYFNVLIYMAVVMFGFSFIFLCMTAFGQLAFDNVLTPLYNAKIAEEKKAASPQKKKKKSVKGQKR